MDATIHHDPYLPDDFTSVDGPVDDPIEPPEPIRHADDKKAVAAVARLVESRADAYMGYKRSLTSVEPPEPYDHTQDRDSNAAVRKLLGRKPLADYKKRMIDAAA